MKINYKVSGEGKSIILLHGWGTQIKSFEPIHKYLENYFRTYSIDFPGFGQSNPPETPWGTEAYACLIKQFLHNLGIINPILIGHSFGGRIAIRLASTEKVSKLILIDSGGIRPKRKFNYYIKVYSYKFIKYFVKLPILRHFSNNLLGSFSKKFGSKDYQNASGIIRATLVKVVNEDLKNFMPQIKVPTLLIWGENDRETPVSDGKLMEKLIPDAGLVILKNVGHFSYLEKLNEFLLIISSFLKDDMGKNNG